MSASSSDRGNERAGGGGEAEEEAKTDGWLNTYADMVTLLLTFFVLMVALSSTDTEKMELFMIALSRDGLTPEQFYEIQDKYQELTLDDFDAWDEEFPIPDSGKDDTDTVDQGGENALKELYERMMEYIGVEEIGEDISLDLSGDYLLIALASDMLFETGSAQMSDDTKDQIAVIGGMIASTWEQNDPFEIIVAGHTDTDPINTPQYPSNWHLSRDRSTNVLLELLASSHLDPFFFSSSAFGEYRPVATNSTDEGKRANRRVEILVSLMRNNPRWDRGMQPD